MEILNTERCQSKIVGFHGTMTMWLPSEERKMFLRELAAMEMIYKVRYPVSGQTMLYIGSHDNICMKKVK